MIFSEGLKRAVQQHNAPAITYYKFYLLGRTLFHEAAWRGEPLKRLPAEWDHARATTAIRRLDNQRVIVADSDFASGVWRIVQSARPGSAAEIAAIADPFCYVSHLSAMQQYGLTNRSPDALHLTTPARAIWNTLRDQKVQREFGPSDPQQGPFPALLKYGFKSTVRGRPVVIHDTKYPAEPVSVRGERSRITSIGRTFADMLSEPHLCGGVRHVIDVWEDEAGKWSSDIIEAVDQLDSKIVKVRAGYLLSEVLGIEDDHIVAWEIFAQRGGSRKLDPDAPYAPTYSERWMISLNA